MFHCAQPNCPNEAKNQCSICKERYCGSECQKLDWKKHKTICPILKKLSNDLQPFHEVQRLIMEIMTSKKGGEVRVLEHLLLFAKHQFGERVVGLCYRERKGGERLNNWNIEINVIAHIIRSLARAYEVMNRHDDIEIRYLQQAIDILTSWLAVLDSDAKCQISGALDDNKINYLVHSLSDIEYRLTLMAITKDQYDIAVEHCQRCLTYSQRYGVEGEIKAIILFDALSTFSFLQTTQGNLKSALTFAEDGYNLLVETYNPAHPKVQKAAGLLIRILISMDRLYDAERYSEITYGNLKDPANGIDPNSKEVAEGAFNLADVIYKQDGDLVKSEKLARESLRIITKLEGSLSPIVGTNSEFLAQILHKQGKHTDEKKELLERLLVIKRGMHGLISNSVACTNVLIAGHHHVRAVLMEKTDSSRKEELLFAKSYYEEGIRIYTLVFDSTHQKTVDAAYMLSEVLLML